MKIAEFEASQKARVKLEQLKLKHTQLEEEINSLMVEALKETCLKIFEDFTEVDTFSWVLYGGEYNDDGPVHGVNCVCINNEWNGERYALLDYPTNGSIQAQLTQRIQSLGDEFLLRALGTYNQVIVTKGGIDVVDYEGY